ncbi:MAG: hypothetical protein NVS3B10_25660 [Polyangiales bacterium]
MAAAPGAVRVTLARGALVMLLGLLTVPLVWGVGCSSPPISIPTPGDVGAPTDDGAMRATAEAGVAE